MQTLLESLALYLTGTFGNDLGNLQIILPNRRAGLFLQHHLSKHTMHVQWSPKIYAINEFLEENSLLTRADQFELLFTLYDLYSASVKAPDPFDEFYHWGELMLRDFDELDKYLVDAKMLFSNVIDLKELEEPLAGMDEKQISFIRQFWAGFHQGDASPEKEKFLEIWKLLPILYEKLTAQLQAAGCGYQGMQYREICSRIENSEFEITGPGRVIVAGFNALNHCEKKIFSWLQKRETDFFWDYDQYYTEDGTQEAGRFLRENLHQFPERIKIEYFNTLEEPKEIRIFELPTDVLQVKTVHKILEEKGEEQTNECTDTAIVLCDEELLMPVIMSFPGKVDEINITMGYPMKNSPVYSFVDQLLRLQSNIRTTREGMDQFYHKDVISILLHPYLGSPDPSPVHTLLEEISTFNMIHVERSRFHGELEQKIFRKVTSSSDALDYLRDIFMYLLKKVSGEDVQLHQTLNREFIFQLLTILNRIELLITKRPSLTVALLFRVFRKLLMHMRVPFEGEPLSGLQVMGILETRMLDFRHVILLSMNEDVMPGSQPGQSYIPYALRLGFGMPSGEDRDAIYAYYFYRLIQRARKIDLIYNSKSEGVRTGEMSRYLYQLIYRLDLPVIRPGMEVRARETPSLHIAHSAEVDEKLSKYLSGKPEGKFISPSAINTYIDCSLKFYLRYLAGIGEAEEVREEIDAAGFGTVVHEAIRLLYSEIAKRNKGVISMDDLIQLRSSEQPGIVLKKAFLQHQSRGRKTGSVEGRNIIILRVMNRYLQKIIEVDQRVAPFKLLSVEESHERNLEFDLQGTIMKIRLGGKIDRVDRVGSILRVIDYKTGNARQSFSSLDALFDSSLGSRNGAAMQTLMYAWLVRADYPDKQIEPGLYIMKELYGKNFDPALTMGSYQKVNRVHSFQELEADFISKLTIVLKHMFNPEIPFTQTDNEIKCRHCDFSGICNRISFE